VSVEGSLSISVNWDGLRIDATRVASTRPRGVAQVLVGKRPADAVAMVPRLFSICGRSQAVAAALACECASDVTSDSATWRARTELVDAEIVHEYLWRMLLDWPRAVGAAGSAPMLAKVRARLAEALDASAWAMRYAPQRPERGESRWDAVRAELAGLLADDVLDAPQGALDDRAGFTAWLESGKSSLARTVAQLSTESADMDAPGVPPLPCMTSALAAGEIARRLDDDERFSGEPEWGGSPRETGARARQHAHPLIAELTNGPSGPILPRLAARIVELADILKRGAGDRIGSAAIRHGDAVAWVETARGVLIHRAALQGERIVRYQIVAPTEWNFHPRGALAVELAALRVADRTVLERRIDLLVQSLDPCVAYRVEVGHA
jgi:Ni,Fe-hydrogenase I large subunit